MVLSCGWCWGTFSSNVDDILVLEVKFSNDSCDMWFTKYVSASVYVLFLYPKYLLN